MSRSWVVVLAAVMGCADGTSDGDDVVDLPEPAPVVTPSGGCPDLSTPGEKFITSNGVERKFEIYFPAKRPENMPVLFAWHGLTATNTDGSSSVYDPIPSLVRWLDLEGLAEDKKAVVVIPESEPIELFGMNVMLWGILDNEANDLALYDDLRACIDEEFAVDLRRVTSFGFSGGGLWTSLLLMERADTLATAVAASGGAGIGDWLTYREPSVKIPAMLISGGEEDIWPYPVSMIVFDETTDRLADGLVEDGNFVVRCQHEDGHYLPDWAWNRSVKWLFNHTYGAPSPYETGDRSIASECAVLSAAPDASVEGS